MIVRDHITSATINVEWIHRFHPLEENVLNFFFFCEKELFLIYKFANIKEVRIVREITL